MMMTIRVVALIIALALSGTLAFAADVKQPSKMTDQAASAAKGKIEQLDINSASEAQLRSIPGVGDTYAKKIIAGRPYAKKDQLKSKNIIPSALYEKIKDRIVARQSM